MTKQNYRHNKGPAFVRITHHLMDSDAFKSLSHSAVRVLILLIQRHNSYNNGRISLSAREIEDNTPMSKGTGNRAIKELVVKGFIEVTCKGKFTVKRASEYRLTFEPTLNYLGKHIQATNEWKDYDKEKGIVPNLVYPIS